MFKFYRRDLKTFVPINISSEMGKEKTNAIMTSLFAYAEFVYVAM